MKATTSSRQPSAPAFLSVLLAVCGSLVIFLTSTPSGVWTGDAAEAQTVPYILGIAHPTGFPLFTLVGWVFSHALAFGTVAWRLNVFSALCTAVGAGGVALLSLTLGCNAVAALAAALIVAFGTIVRSDAVLASPHALASALAVWALGASVAFVRSNDRRALFAACGCTGFGLATHPQVIWVVPAVIVAALWRRDAMSRSTALVAVFLLLAPLATYAYLPVRSAIVMQQHLDPAAGAPLYGAGSIDWDTNAPRTLDGFLNEVLGRREHAGNSLANAFDVRLFPRACASWLHLALREFDAWVLVMAAFGTIALAQRDRRSLCVLLAGAIGGIAFLYTYRLDAEASRYAYVSFAATATLAAAATRLRVPSVNPMVISRSAAVVLAVGTILAWRDHRSTVLTSPAAGGRAIIDAVVRDVPDGAIVVAPWDEASALGYGAAVEHALGSRTVVSAWPSEYADRYPAWARQRRVVIYAGGVALTMIDQIPPAWLRQLPTTDAAYRAYEVR